MMEPLLEFRDVKMYFRARKGLLRTTLVKAVDGVSLAIYRGEMLALVGESGSGKTTLGRLALGLLRPTSGTILFDGKDISRMGRGEHSSFRRRCQAIFQDPYSSLNPFMTVGEIVEEPLIIHGLGDRRRRVLQALEDVGLKPPEEFSRKHVFNLSGGQRQRVAIARALALQPDFIVADEPVSMIDASSRAEVLLLLHRLRREHGITLLYITHDIATARHFSDRIAVMYLGRVVELGPTESVIERPMHPYTLSLIAAVPEPRPDNLQRDLYAIPGEPPSAESIPPGCRFHPRCPFYINALCNAVDPPLARLDGHRQAACLLHEGGEGTHPKTNNPPTTHHPPVRRLIGGRVLELVQGDITELEVDAIVNAANSSLKMGGGVAGAILRKGGWKIQEECDRIGHCPVGGAVITSAGRLKAKYVIHAVGPRLGEGDEDEKLRSATISSLRLADEHGVRSIAFPAISTGAFGFPKERCARIMTSTVAEYLRGSTGLERVVFCLYDRETFEVFAREVGWL